MTVLCVGHFPPGDERTSELGRYVRCAFVSDPAAALEVLASRDVEAVLLEADTRDPADREAWWSDVRRLAPGLPVLLLGGRSNAEDPWAAGAVTRREGESTRDLVARVVVELEKLVLQASLNRGDAWLDQLIDHNPYAIAIHDREGRHVRVNHAFVELFGPPAPPHLSIFDHDHHRDPAMVEKHERLRQGEAIACPPTWFNPREVHAGGKDRRLCVSVAAFPLMDSRGAMRYFVTMFEDVTARALAEEAVAEAHRRLQEAHDELEVRVLERTQALEQEMARREGLQRRLLEKNRELEDFSFRVGHDLKNSLFAIRSILEVGRADPALAGGSTDVVVATTHRLIDFVERLLQMARAGRIIGQKQPTDLAPLLWRVFERSRPAGCDVEMVVREPMPKVLVDVSAMEQAVGKLFDNSFQYRDPERPLRIEVEASLEGKRVEIHVRDNGRGIEPPTLAGLFSMCFKTENEDRIGFGLPIVKKIIEAHGGTVRAESRGRDQGAAIVIDLPARPEDRGGV